MHGENVIILEHVYGAYYHVDNTNKHILILVERQIQELDDTTLTAEAKYPINFTQ